MILDSQSGALIRYLLDNSNISNLVGARIYPHKAKQGASLPNIAYFQSGGDSAETHCGFNDLEELFVNFYCYGSTDVVANSLALTLRAELNKLQQVDLPEGTNSVWIHKSKAVSVDAGADEPKDSSDCWKYWSRILLQINFEI